MIGSDIPATLVPPKPLSAISTERALKQILELLDGIESSDDDALNDRVEASIADVETMLRCIK